MKRDLFVALSIMASAVPAHSEATQTLTAAVAASTMDDVDFKPSLKSVDGKRQSYYRSLPSPPGVTGVHMGVWKAEPGEYRHPGGAGVETFVVTQGRGKILLAGAGEHVLQPGVIITIPANTASTLTVQQSIRKFSTQAELK